MSERIVGTDYCELANRWQVVPEVMRLVQLSAEDFERETAGIVRIISGFRTRAEQEDLRESGRPTAPDHLSTHRTCPATGVDVSLGFLPVNMQKATWGRIVTFRGLRWGGGSGLDADFIPIDWGHVDMGPRA